MIGNTAPFDVTGHPAMSIPCGLGDGLPIGAMLIGKHFDEETIYAAAAAFEGVGRLEDVLTFPRCRGRATCGSQTARFFGRVSLAIETRAAEALI